MPLTTKLRASTSEAKHLYIFLIPIRFTDVKHYLRDDVVPPLRDELLLLLPLLYELRDELLPLLYELRDDDEDDELR